MKERPILFSGAMVKAIREGRKTQTRRIVKPQPYPDGEARMISGGSVAFTAGPVYGVKCPYGTPGERLWVRETWAAWDSVSDSEASELECSVGDMVEMGISQAHISYRADPRMHADRWRPSIFMPRWASRITLEIVSVRVERLQDISEEDAVAEGVERNTGDDPWVPEDGWLKYPIDSYVEDFPAITATESYRTLWESINGPGSWDRNPYVWCISFRRINAS